MSEGTMDRASDVSVPSVPARRAAPDSTLRARWRTPWRSPADQPPYARPALLATAAVAAALFAWGIDRTGYHTFYANAARSMSESWRGFLFGSFDPGNAITLDKLPGFLWPQALSARIFGFHAWALELPQVIEGVLCVLVLYRVVRLWAGVPAALIAAAAFTATPVTAGVFRTPAEDALFTLLLLLAAEAAQRAAHTGRFPALLMSGVWVGLAFQAKMLEAWAVLPALAVLYVIAAPGGLRRRLGHLGLAGLVMTAVSASWIVVATLTPASDRPYIDGTTNNSPAAMVVGYNFLNRFASVGLSADGTGSVSAVQGGGGHRPGGPYVAGGRSSDVSQRAFPGRGGEDNGWGKMFGSAIASQTGWLYPFAAIALVAGLLWSRRRPRTDHQRAGYVLWGGWLVTFVLVFSAGSVGGHMYYMGVVDLPLAALTGAGLVLLWTAFRTGGKRAYVLPAAVVASAAWACYLARAFPSYLPWLAPAILALGAGSAILLMAFMRRPASYRLMISALAATVAVLLLAPASWAASIFTLSGRGAFSQMGAVGPAGGGGHNGAFRGWMGLDRSRRGGVSATVGLPGGFGRQDGSGQGLAAWQQSMVSYLQQHQKGARYLFAVPNWNTASSYILAKGLPVLPMGGFTGQVPFPTLAQFHHLIASGQLHYVLLPASTDGMGSMRGRIGRTTSSVTSWVGSTCAPIAPDDYGGGSPASILYRCPS